MAQIIHCFMLLYIVFIIAEIRNVLVSTDPHPVEPVTIWEEVQPSAGIPNYGFSPSR
jgi:hypothetical protein